MNSAPDAFAFLGGAFGAMLVGAALLIVLRLAPPRDRDDKDVVHLLFAVAGWVLMLIGGMGVALLLLSAWGVGLWLAALVVGVMGLNRGRSAQRSMLLRGLTIA